MEKQAPIPQDTARIPTNGHSRPANLSSSMTLFWRVFLPVFGTVFFTGLLVALWVTTEEDLYLSYPIWWLRTIVLTIWLVWLFFARTTLWPLKRVDADDAHLYVTNYWLTVRYPWTDVERMDETKKMGRRIAQLHLKAPGRFGQVIKFLPGSRYREWMQEHEKGYLLGEN
ncbi:MAG: hypothetical protein IPM98_01790 [Lewinellaceae bacterium]|nr:hypothetical protein [Lewinellaceae bacterium]